MQCRWWLTGLLICCMLGGAIPGCNAFQGAATDADEDLFAELDDLGVNSDAPAASAAPLADAGAAGAASATMTPAPPRWRLGDRFPLEKTVFQKVTQVGLGTPSAGSERLQLLLSLTVEEVSSERARFGVRYHRVRLVREMAGETFDYDSGSSTAAPPPAALAYAGMINDGFSFWLTTDGRVGDLVGFSEFLRSPRAGRPPKIVSRSSRNWLSSSRDKAWPASWTTASACCLRKPTAPVPRPG